MIVVWFWAHSIVEEWRSVDRHYSCISIFLGELWSRMPIRMKWLFNLCFRDTPLMQAFKSNIFKSTSNVPVKLVVLNQWPSTKRVHLKFLMEKPHFVWKWARGAATRRCWCGASLGGAKTSWLSQFKPFLWCPNGRFPRYLLHMRHIL